MIKKDGDFVIPDAGIPRETTGGLLIESDKADEDI